MAVYDSLGSYVLFSTQSDSKTRLWNRDNSLKCIYPRALKYHVLKNPPATDKKSRPLLRPKFAPKIFRLGTAQYAIDTVVYDPLIESHQANPILNLTDLQKRIALIRLQLNFPNLAAEMKKEPLLGLKRVSTYNSIGDQWTQTKTKRTFDVDFKVGENIDINIENYPLIAEFQSFFPRRQLVLKNAQYIYALRNNGCDYARTIDDLFINASRSGALVTAIKSRIKFLETKEISFFPLLTFMVPDSPKFREGDYPVKFGVLFGISPRLLEGIDFPAKENVLNAVAENSELIFVPIQTELDRIENEDLDVGTRVTFPMTNGGDLNLNLRPIYQRFKQLLPDGLSWQNKFFNFDNFGLP